MRNSILYLSLSILLGICTVVNGQGLNKLKPDYFYQEWSLASINSTENLRIYKPKKIVSSETTNTSSAVLQFKKRSRVFYFINHNRVKKERALNWTKPYKVKKPLISRCGTPPSRPYRVKHEITNTRHSNKGMWKAYAKNDIQFLVLKHLVAKGNVGYILEKKEKFQIVSLEKDKMILQKM